MNKSTYSETIITPARERALTERAKLLTALRAVVANTALGDQLPNGYSTAIEALMADPYCSHLSEDNGDFNIGGSLDCDAAIAAREYARALRRFELLAD